MIDLLATSLQAQQTLTINLMDELKKTNEKFDKLEDMIRRKTRKLKTKAETTEKMLEVLLNRREVRLEKDRKRRAIKKKPMSQQYINKMFKVVKTYNAYQVTASDPGVVFPMSTPMSTVVFLALFFARETVRIGLAVSSHP